ncbi:MAG: YgiT-type zinc finger protein [Planctomycetota bacterium]
MKTTVQITHCPSCGSNQIKRVRRNWTGEYQGHVYTVPALEFYECPSCCERIYDRYAMRHIQAHSPAYKQKCAKEEFQRLPMLDKAKHLV